MITVYVLKSLSDEASYVGMAKDADNRLKEHNAGKNRYTKGHLPWVIIYTEKHADWVAARVREKYLKTSAGKKWLIKERENRKSHRGSLPDCFKQAGIPVRATKPLRNERLF